MIGTKLYWLVLNQGTKSVVSSEAVNARFTTVPGHLYLNNNVEDIVVILGF